MNAEIIAVGSELLTPYRIDTNSLFITEELNKIGVEVLFKTVVGDVLAHIEAAARIALSRANLIIFSGGLGPTEDDVTREAVAATLGLALKRDPDLVAELYARFAARRIRMPENNARQADVIAGSTLLKNLHGTAPGQWLETNHAGRPTFLVLLPGPPNELEPMFSEQCLSEIRKRAPEGILVTRVLKVAMMPESECDMRVAPIYKRHPEIQTTILSSVGEVQLHLRTRSASSQGAQKILQVLSDQIEDELDDYIFSTGGESLEQIVGYYLQLRNATLAVAESCTGGLLAQRVTSVSGSSRYFLGGVVVYENDLKTSLALVPPMLITEHGAVSSEVAAAMAEGIRRNCKSSFGIGITGVAGPSGGTADKPVGLVFHALSDGVKTEIIERRFSGDRERIRLWASQQALDMLRKHLAA